MAISSAVNLLSRAEPSRAPPAPPMVTQCTDSYSFLPDVCYVGTSSASLPASADIESAALF